MTRAGDLLFVYEVRDGILHETYARTMELRQAAVFMWGNRLLLYTNHARVGFVVYEP